MPNETWHRVDVAPVYEDGWLAVTLRSLTEEKRMNQLRSDFIANASHELRTPLTSLIGFIDTLLGPAANVVVVCVCFFGIMRQQAGRGIGGQHQRSPVEQQERVGQGVRQAAQDHQALVSRNRLGHVSLRKNRAVT